MLLSENSQKLYHNFQDRLLNKAIISLDNNEYSKISNFLNDTPLGKSKNENQFLQKNLVEEIKRFSSGLRTSLTQDIGSREDPKISSTYGNLRTTPEKKIKMMMTGI